MWNVTAVSTHAEKGDGANAGDCDEYLDQKIHVAACDPLQKRLRVMRDSVEGIALLSAVTASISFTIAETRLFKPLRERLRRRSEFIGELIPCGYCLGHWVALASVVIYQPRLLVSWWPLDYVLTALVIAWLSAFQWVLMCLLMAEAEK